MTETIINTLSDLNLDTYPYIIVKNHNITFANEYFYALSGYCSKDIINSSFSYLWKELLRITIPLENVEYLEHFSRGYMFTKLREVMEINIRSYSVQYTKEKLYIFNKRFNCVLDDKFDLVSELNSSNGAGVALFSVPGYIQLKANANYFSIMKDYCNDHLQTTGLPIDRFMIDWNSSNSKDIWDSVIKTGQTFCDSEFYINRPGIEDTYMDYTLTPLRESGEIRYLVLRMRKITELVKNKKLLEERTNANERHRALLEAIIENISEGLIILSSDGNYVRHNKALRELYNSVIPYDKEASMPPDVKYYVDSVPLSFEELPIYKALKGEIVKDINVTLKQPGKVIELRASASPIFDREGNIIAGIACVRDITEELRHEQIILEQKERLQAIIDNMSDAVFMVGKDGKAEIFNDAAKDLIYDEETFKKIGDSLNTTDYYDCFGHKLQKGDMPAVRILKGEHIKGYFLKAVRQDKTCCYNISGAPVYDKSGLVSSALLCCSDITKYAEAEEKIKEQQKLQLVSKVKEKEELEKVLRMKDEFLSIISHEFKTPLTIIDAAVQMLENIYKDELSPKVKDLIHKIHINSFRQLRLVNNLLDITKLDSGQLRVHKRNIDIVALTRTVTESVLPYASQKGIKLFFSSAHRSKTIGIDEEKYERILLNLLSNAVKFTPGGKAVSVNVYSREKHVLIEVKDEGVGIPKQLHSHIFKPFGQVDSSLSRQAEGTGLGLSIVKSLVSALNGYIDLESKPAEGSTFRIVLPSARCNKNEGMDSFIKLMDHSLIKDVNVEFSDVYCE